MACNCKDITGIAWVQNVTTSCMFALVWCFCSWAPDCSEIAPVRSGLTQGCVYTAARFLSIRRYTCISKFPHMWVWFMEKHALCLQLHYLHVQKQTEVSGWLAASRRKVKHGEKLLFFFSKLPFVSFVQSCASLTHSSISLRVSTLFQFIAITHSVKLHMARCQIVVASCLL